MRSFEITEFGIDNLQIGEKEVPNPGAGQVLVRMTAASLNYRDWLVVAGLYNPKMRRPMIPLSDGAGIVEAVGEGVTRVRAGDRVAGCFMQTWIEGPPTREAGQSALGGSIDGVLAEYVLFSEQGVVKIPSCLNDLEAASLPCAAVTAWHALFEELPSRPGETLLIQGTGGVALFALQFGKTAGLRTILISSSDEKIARAQQLGADLTVNYKKEPEWEKAVREMTGGRGVDHVIEVGGAQTLPRSMKAARTYGIISMIGILSGAEATVSPNSILMSSLRIQGIYVGSRAMFERMLRLMEQRQIKPVIDRTFSWQEFPDALRHMEKQTHFGKICLQF